MAGLLIPNSEDEAKETCLPSNVASIKVLDTVGVAKTAGKQKPALLF